MTSRPAPELRDYQLDAVRRAETALAERSRPILASPTGSGKTVIAAHLAARARAQGKTVLFVAPRRELVYQTVESFQRLGMYPGVIMSGEKPSAYADVQVASMQTLYSRLKRGRVPPRADLLLIDECHLSISPSALTVMSAYPDAGVVGLTATPARGDGRALGMVYTDLIAVATTAGLTEQGWLCPAIYYAPTAPDLSRVRIDPKSKDYHQGDLAGVMDRPKLVGDVVDHWMRLARDRRTVVFASSVQHSAHIVAEFSRVGIAAEHVDANTPHGERKAIFDRFRSGETQVLSNCFLASYGFDLPDLSCVVLARPTKSLVLYLQMVGRGLRPGKDSCLVLDHTGAVHHHGMADSCHPWSLDGASTIQDRADAARKERKEPKDITCGQCGRVFRLSPLCPSCGWIVPRPKKDVATADGQLQLVGKREKPAVSHHEKSRMWGELQGYAQEKGYKPGWAWHKFVSLYEQNPRQAGVAQVGPKRAGDKVRALAKYWLIRYAKSQQKGSQHERI